MWGGADETEQLPEGSGLVPPSAAFSLNGKPKSPDGAGAAGSMVGGSAIQSLKSGKRKMRRPFRERVPVRALLGEGG